MDRGPAQAPGRPRAARTPSTARASTACSRGAQDPNFDAEALTARLGDFLNAHRLRCVIVIDAVPPDLAELVGYLQDMTSDRLNLDLVTVTAYDVDDRRVLVPQLVEPDRQPGRRSSRP